MRNRLVVVLAALGALAAIAAPAGADHGALHYQKGRVTHIADGDTYDVQIFSDNTSVARRVRMTSIQTMEHDQCHFARAERSLRRMIGGERVRLGYVDQSSVADDPNRAQSRQRILRYTDRRRDGSWSWDIGLTQIERGNALWLPHLVEDARHRKYHKAMIVTAQKQKGIWNPDYCGEGPYADNLPLKMWVQSDAPLNDKDNVNGEWVKLQNLSASPIAVGGWTIRGAGQIGFRIPGAGGFARIQPRQTLTIHVGRGTNRTGHIFMNQSNPRFMNIFEYPHGYIGDGAYLVDPHGDFRKRFTYPCLPSVQDCDPQNMYGKLKITNIQWDAPGGQPEPPSGEWVTIKNVTDKPVGLYGYVLESQPYLYDFKPGTVIPAGETLRVVVGKGTDTPDTVYWGLNLAIFQQTGDSVTLRSYDYMTISCREFQNPPPDRQCPSSRFAAYW